MPSEAFQGLKRRKLSGNSPGSPSVSVDCAPIERNAPRGRGDLRRRRRVEPAAHPHLIDLDSADKPRSRRNRLTLRSSRPRQAPAADGAWGQAFGKSVGAGIVRARQGQRGVASAIACWPVLSTASRVRAGAGGAGGGGARCCRNERSYGHVSSFRPAPRAYGIRSRA